MSLDAIWDALASVPDPEIPVVSVVELGIVRGGRVGPPTGALEVRVTPTYSGCPATELIMDGDPRARWPRPGSSTSGSTTRLSPAWTTDWIAPEARRKLARLRHRAAAAPAGVAPSTSRASVRCAARAIRWPCPRCGSTRHALLAQFGSTACKAQYRCEACREPFDYFKPH